MTELKEIICLVFAHLNSPRPLAISKVKQALACYLGVPPETLNDEDVLKALRECPFAVPQVKTRGIVNISWSFNKPIVHPFKEKKQPKKHNRKWREKPLADSLKLKTS